MLRSPLPRTWLLASLAIAASMAFILPAAHAAAPIRGGQAPGYYRIMVGSIEVTALSDGTIDFPMDSLLIGESPNTLRDRYEKAFQKLPQESSMNQFLVNTGTKLVLVDAGAGTFYGPTLGHTVANLRAAGYTPEQVDDVVITHMHADHIGGLAKDGKAVFPHAVLHIARADVAFWTDPANESKAPEGVRGSFAVAKAVLAPYVAAGKLKTFDGETEIVDGIRAVPAPGHTPGHSFYRVESKGDALLLWGDVVHAAAVQFSDPSVRIAWDGDDHGAEGVREAVLADAAKQGYLVGGAHLPFPALGHIARGTDGARYAFVPVTYLVNRRP